MVRIFLLLSLIFYSNLSLAEVVTGIGSYTHTGDISINEGCKLAKEKAKLNALEKALGQTISSEELEKCSEIDGKSNCERNQFFLSSFNGEISKLKEINKNETTESLSSGETIYICKIEIEANVIPANQITDPGFDFNIKFNNYNFRTGDELKIEIGITKPMYMNIFQLLPYQDPKNYQAFKLFPNERETNSFIKSTKTKLPINGKYEVFFPEEINRKSVDEYLLFIASNEKMNFLDEYTTIVDLKSAYLRATNRVKYKFKAYTIMK